MQDPATRAVASFRSQFGEPPKAAARAPGRVNLIGDHTDYNGGLALPAAIQLGAAVAIGPSDKPSITAYACDFDQMRSIAAEGALQPRVYGGWLGYAPASAMMMLHRISCDSQATTRTAPPGLRMTIASNVPAGCGLSSSAALEVAAATAVEALLCTKLDPWEKAMLCRKTEHQCAGCPCGLMDQLTAIMGQQDHALCMDFGAMTVEPVPLPTGFAWVLLPSLAVHDNATGEYRTLRDSCEAAASACGVKTLAQLGARGQDEKWKMLDERQVALAKHVFTENRRVRRFVEAIGRSDRVLAGSLMDESHESLARRLGVSCEPVERVVATLRSCRDVYGCRMTGAGFGGFVVALVDEEHVQSVVKHFHASHEGEALLVMPSAGCRVVRLA